jgi:hypothetical protein
MEVKWKNSMVGSIFLWLSMPEVAFIGLDEDARSPR